jgi:Fic family protein
MSGPYGKEKVHYEAPAAEVLAMEISRFLEWFEHSRGSSADPLQEGLLRAGLVHLWFETLHPFEDGNGRVGRALIDLALAQDGKQPTRLYGISRQLAKAHDEYYVHLEKAQKGTMDVTQWLLWFMEQFNAACTESIIILEGSLEKARY